MGTKFGVLSDIHVGYDGVEPYDELERSVDVFEREGVENVFVLGDVVHDAVEPAEAVEQLENVDSSLESESFETHYVPGNHDQLSIHKERFARTLGCTFGSIEAGDGTAFCLLDTAYGCSADNVGFLGGQRMLLESAIDVYDDVIVLTHYPLSYTDQYCENDHFSEYPEGFFAADKFTVSEMLPDVTACIYGHAHRRMEWRNDETFHRTVEPFLNIPSGTVRGSVYVFDTTAPEYPVKTRVV